MIQGASAAAIVTAIASLAVAIFTLIWNEVRYRREHRAEAAVQKLLTLRGWKQRTFEKIKGKIGGYKDEELRRLLVRSGAVMFKSGETELWGLLSKNKTSLKGKSG